jgi:hypothetical protein
MLGSHFCRMAAAVKADIKPDAVTMRILRAAAVVQRANGRAHLIQQAYLTHATLLVGQ